MTVAEILSLVVLAFDEIRKLVKSPATAGADDLAHVIAGIYDAIDGAVTGAISPDQAQEHIEVLLAAIRSNDAAADTALDAKFK